MKLLSSAEVADMLSLSKRTVAEKLIFHSDFPLAYRIGRTRRWDYDDIIKYIKSKKEKRTGRPRAT